MDNILQGTVYVIYHGQALPGTVVGTEVYDDGDMLTVCCPMVSTGNQWITDAFFVERPGREVFTSYDVAMFNIKLDKFIHQSHLAGCD